MSNIEKLKFPALDITGANYIQWTGYVKRHLKSMGALATIQEGNKYTEETKAKADVFLHQHIDKMLAFEYSNSEKNNELLMKNYQSRPIGSLAIPEANVVNNNDNKNSGSKRGRGDPRGRRRGRGHYGHNRFPNRNYTYHRGGYNGRGRGQRSF
ncbi:hypothetical protein Tco_0700773 [Tanacetum coccineum]